MNVVQALLPVLFDLKCFCTFLDFVGAGLARTSCVALAFVAVAFRGPFCGSRMHLRGGRFSHSGIRMSLQSLAGVGAGNTAAPATPFVSCNSCSLYCHLY